MAEGAANSDLNNGDFGKASSFASFKAQLVLQASKADEAVQFYKVAFGAEELNRVNHPKRKAEQELPIILCAELKIGTSSFLVCDQTDDYVAGADGSGSGIIFRLETDDVAGAVAKAVDAGAVPVGEIAEGDGACCGGLFGKVKDPFGVVWVITSAEKKSCEPES